MSDIKQMNDNLVKHALKPEWAPLLEEIWLEHIAFTAMLAEADIEHITAILKDRGWKDILFGLVFEDFATSELEQDAPAPNFALAYLKRAGWRETPRARRFLASLATSRPSLYEVLEVKLDEGLRLQDKLNPSKPVWVKEKSATHHLRRWDILYARVIHPEPDEEACITGGILRFPPDSGAELLSLVHAIKQEYPKDSEQPRLALLAFAQWVAAALDRLNRALDITNHDGHALVMCEARIPLRILPGAVTQKLDASQDWERSEPGQLIWHQTRAIGRGEASGFDTLINGQRLLIASAELEGRTLIVQTNSEERLDAALDRLRTLLGASALGTPSIERISPSDQLAAVQDGHAEHKAPHPGPLQEDQQAILKDVLDAHYRRTLRQRIPALGDKTPRMAMRTKSGRKKVIEWLKLIENASQAQGYDASWMWDELGLTDERGDRST
jgi:hypothetical protein